MPYIYYVVLSATHRAYTSPKAILRTPLIQYVMFIVLIYWFQSGDRARWTTARGVDYNIVIVIISRAKFVEMKCNASQSFAYARFHRYFCRSRGQSVLCTLKVFYWTSNLSVHFFFFYCIVIRIKNGSDQQFCIQLDQVTIIINRAQISFASKHFHSTNSINPHVTCAIHVIITLIIKK